MPGRLDHRIKGGARYQFVLWWPLQGSGYYDFTGGSARIQARDMHGNMAFTFTGTSGSTNLSPAPTLTDCYFSIQTGSSFSAANDQTIPAGSWIKGYLTPAFTSFFQNQILTYEALFTPSGQDAFALLEGGMVFTPSTTVPEVFFL